MVMGPWRNECGKSNPTEVKPNITFNDQHSEMLRIDSDAFYVRGQRVPIDEKEALTVYNAFKQWLSWAILNQREY